MIGFILRTLVTAFGLWLAATLVPGISISGSGTLFLAALLLGLVNGLVRPLAVFFTLPLTLLTLGLFLLVINAAMFGLVAAMLDGFQVAGFFSALLGWLVVSLTSTVASWYIGPSGRYQVLVIERRH
jgi:putative membrane protein